MTCRGREGDLARYVAGELDEAACEGIRAHLAGCPRCRAAEQALRRNASALKALGDVALPAEWQERVHKRVTRGLLSPVRPDRPLRGESRARAAAFAALAACLALAFVAGMAWLLTREPPSQGQAERHAPPRVARSSPAPGVTAEPPRAVPGTQPNTPASRPAVERPAPRPLALAENHPPDHGPQRKKEALVIRLQTDDPTVVVYWQFTH